MKYEKIIFDVIKDEKKRSEWLIQRDYAINANALYSAKIIENALKKADEIKAKLPEMLRKYDISSIEKIDENQLYDIIRKELEY